jgi:hypothetical protein
MVMRVRVQSLIAWPFAVAAVGLLLLSPVIAGLWPEYSACILPVGILLFACAFGLPMAYNRFRYGTSMPFQKEGEYYRAIRRQAALPPQYQEPHSSPAALRWFATRLTAVANAIRSR